MFRNIVTTFANCFKIPELKSRIWFTVGVLAICRLAALIPIPWLNGAALAKYMEENDRGGVLGLFNMFTGGGMEHCAIGSLGIMPYISATIIIQLLSAVIPSLSKMAREEGGRTKIIQYGRYLTVLLCIGWGAASALGWENPQNIFSGFTGKLVLFENLWLYRILTIIALTAGTMVLMWLGEQITERGIGNGISLIITVNILARLPQAATGLIDMFSSRSTSGGGSKTINALMLLSLLLIVIAIVIAITQAQRKIPVQYAQRAVGRKVYSGGTSFMPLRVNYPGVMPIIFAGAVLMFPQQILFFIGNTYKIPFLTGLAGMLHQGAPLYLTIYGLMILAFSYFWVATQFNEIQIADDLKKNGGYIPGVRPGQATSDYLHNSMSRITLAGAVILVVIAVIPQVLYDMMGMPNQVAQFFGGTSMLITVGVLLDTMRQMESHLMMRHYDGFLKKGKVKGRI
ncbi:MAG: preprotein translocase subunit SecY [Verrucomicrobiota bacterium]